MSAKRRPGNELTHDNWDDEEDQEEQGEFRKASEEEMKQRTIKVAKRRVPARTAGVGGEYSADGGAVAAGSTGVFSGFSGFGSVAATKSSASSPFAFLSSGSGSSLSATGSSASPFASISFGAKPTTENGNKAIAQSPEKTNVAAPGGSAGSKADDATSKMSSSYYAKLKGLNQSVSAWISKHVSENPVCKLTPIFEDYAKFLQTIEKSEVDKPEADSCLSATPVKTPDFTFSSAAPTASSSSKPTTESVQKIAFGAPASSSLTKTTGSVFQMPSFSASTQKDSVPPTTTSATTSTSTFSFGSVPATTTTSTPSSSTFSFGSVPAASSTGFSFGGFGSTSSSTTTTSTPFSFSNVSAAPAPAIAGPSTSSASAAVDDDNEEPPKNEFTPVVEEDSLFTKRCKIFVKTGGEFVDRGVGQLFIKSADDGKKTQMLVRADTNLGNILLNILLTEAVPASRMGKNNVMMICIPTPDAKPPPATVLVRVKNAEEADELLEQIQKHKK